uniref:Uncharacterized protein n=1 Tax=Octopus bimaculoides TaxID=37653 RepID=A0A0L8G1I7_OCTBM
MEHKFRVDCRSLQNKTKPGWNIYISCNFHFLFSPSLCFFFFTNIYTPLTSLYFSHLQTIHPPTLSLYKNQCVCSLFLYPSLSLSPNIFTDLLSHSNPSDTYSSLCPRINVYLVSLSPRLCHFLQINILFPLFFLSITLLFFQRLLHLTQTLAIHPPPPLSVLK